MNEPEQVAGTVEMVSVEWLMQNLTYSVDGLNDTDNHIDFFRLVRNKASDGCFADLVNTIWDRGFRVPICLYPCERDSSEGGWGLGNGHHRMSAAILMCLDSIPVYWSEHEYMSSHKTDTENLLDMSYEDRDAFLDLLRPLLDALRP